MTEIIHPYLFWARKVEADMQRQRLAFRKQRRIQVRELDRLNQRLDEDWNKDARKRRIQLRLPGF